MQLDEYQSKFVSDEYALDKAVLVKACAGSGKTTTILAKALILTEQGIKPKEIVALAFGNKAARELKLRYSTLKPKDSRNIICSTIHSFCYSILRDYFGMKRTILTEWKATVLLRDILEQKDKDKELNKKELTSLAKEIYSEYNKIRIKGGEIKNKEALGIIKELEEAKDKYQYFDYTDMLFVCYNKLKDNPKILEQVKNKYKVWLIDEAQDLDQLQYNIILLLGQGKYCCFVGDVMQTLYKFRLATPENFSEYYLSEYFTTVVSYPLLSNYRSLKNIVTISNNVRMIQGDKLRGVAVREKITGAVKMTVVRNNIQEGTKAAKIIKESLENGKTYKDIAIICRTNSYIKTIIEPALIRENIPYKLISRAGGNRILEKDSYNIYFNMLLHLICPSDMGALYDIAMYIHGIGEETINRIKNKQYKPSDKGKIENINNLQKDILDLKNYDIDNSSIFIYQMNIICRKYLDYDKYFTEKDVNNIEASLGFWIKYYIDDGQTNLQDIIQLILSEVQDFDNEEDCDVIPIYTVHSAKGLEFDTVIASGYNSPTERADKYGDEAYILYVQLSRAKNKLYIIDSYSYITKDKKVKTPFKNKTMQAIIKEISNNNL